MVAEQQSETAPLFRPRRLGHANLFVSDWERSMDFYTKIGGIEEVYRRPPVQGGFLSNGNTHHDIAVMGVSGPAGKGRDGRPGLNHLGFELENQAELVKGYNLAVERDMTAYNEDHDIARGVYCPDPDGNFIEVYADTVKDWRARRHGTINRPSPTWSPDSEPPTDILYDPNPEIRRVDEAVFHPMRTTHAVLVISDAKFEAAVRYYAEFAGLEPVLGGADRDHAALGGTVGERSLGLFRERPGLEPGFHHVGLRVWDESDLERSIERAGERGIEIFANIDHETRRSVCIHDPDGIILQFYVDRPVPLTTLDGVDRDAALYLV